MQNTQHDLVKIAPMAALTGADIGKSSLSSRSAYPDPKSRDENAVLCKIMPTVRCRGDAIVTNFLQNVLYRVTLVVVKKVLLNVYDMFCRLGGPLL